MSDRGAWLIGVLLLASAPLRAQERADSTGMELRHSIFGELGGLGNGWSANYAATLPIAGDLKAGLRAGMSYYWFERPHGVLFPLEACILWGRNHHAEIATGYTLIFSMYDLGGNGKSWLYDPSSTISIFAGYRYQRYAGGFFLRFGLYAPIDFDPAHSTDLNYAPSKRAALALGLGYTFTHD